MSKVLSWGKLDSSRSDELDWLIDRVRSSDGLGVRRYVVSLKCDTNSDTLIEIWKNEQPRDWDAVMQFINKGCPSTKQSRKSGYIYVVRGGEYYKIGHSIDVNRRLTEFAPKLPFETEVVMTVRVTDRIAAESFLHRMFAEKRTNGEWFLLTDADLELIQRTFEFYRSARGARCPDDL